MVKKSLKVIWDDQAKNSLKHIYHYIKNRESISIARKVRNQIALSANSLVNFPEKYESEPNLKDEPGNYRYKVIWSYKIIYELTDESIYILDIFHTSRDPSNIKKQ